MSEQPQPNPVDAQAQAETAQAPLPNEQTPPLDLAPAAPARRNWSSSSVIGLGLIGFGGLLLVARLFGIHIGQFIWPLFIIVPGVFLLVVALNTQGQVGEPFAILGSIVTMLGLLLMGMSVSGLWASWAYAWALLFPTSIGLGEILYGIHTHQDHVIKTGRNLVMIGLAIFSVGFLFFEALLHINHLQAIDLCLPVALIGVGVVLLWRAVRGSR